MTNEGAGMGPLSQSATLLVWADELAPARPDLLATFETGVRYHMYHALALLACAWIVERWPSPQAVWAGWLFVVGITVFSGSLYLLTLTGARWWGAVTPVGGIALLSGWVCLAWGVARSA